MSANQYHRAITFAASLAWFQLFAEKRRLMAAIAGVGIAAILMLVQLGIRDALFDSGVLHYSHRFAPPSNGRCRMTSKSSHMLS
jgi:hypothetical protein